MSSTQLLRTVGVSGAIMMGLGSIIGTGVFVSLGLAAGIAGEAVLFALVLAGGLAICNGLSTAQLAAAHPMSGGTYEYGYKYLNPWLGFLAGWLFVCAKSASAATAAMGFGGYFIQLLGLAHIQAWHVGLVLVIALLVLTTLGMRRSNIVNITIVSVTLLSLGLYIIVIGYHVGFSALSSALIPSLESSPFKASLFLEATALMFVAYTGYGRIATLGEEITQPVKNIPKAIIFTLGVSFALYLMVAVVSLAAVGSAAYWQATVDSAAPLQLIAESKGHQSLAIVLALGAVTAMAGVLLNLILGLSRVIYAMGRKGDLPSVFAYVDSKHQVPTVAILAVCTIILTIVVLSDVKLAWSFSAFTVLIYYAITNAAALKLAKKKRLYPRALAWLGLAGCISLSIWISKEALVLGLSIMAAGVVWRLVFRRISSVV